MPGQEVRELHSIHFARRHREVAVLSLASPAGVAVDRDVVGWVCEHRCGQFPFKDGFISQRFQRRSAEKAMTPKTPDIARARYRGALRRLEFVCRIDGVRRLKGLHAEINFRQFESCRFHLEVECNLVKLLEAKRQLGIIP